jgi:peptidoglycan hydrolase-like protein with peptidoglycan-binding domain
MGLLRRGLSGEPVRLLQEKLGVGADGIFGAATEEAVKKFQRDNGLSADGIAGPDTFLAIGMPELVFLHKPLRGNTVRRLQEALGIGADGVYGGGTESAVKAFQEQNGLPVSGVVDPAMLAIVPGFSEFTPQAVEVSQVTDATPQVDPGAVEEVKLAIEAPPDKGIIDNIVDAATLVPRSIWNTVKSIF